MSELEAVFGQKNEGQKYEKGHLKGRIGLHLWNAKMFSTKSCLLGAVCFLKFSIIRKKNVKN